MIRGLTCPECYGEGSLRLDWDSGKSYVCCEDCRAHTQLYDEDEAAIRDWNNGRVISRLEVKQVSTEHEAEILRVIPREEVRLRPCPYCGSEASVIHDKNSNGYYVACENEECYAHTEVCGGRIGAVDDWNEGAVFQTWYRRVE